jgi:hypothetical protein
LAFCPLTSTIAAAPSLILEELPAVTEPFFLKVGPSFLSFAELNFARLSSLSTISGGFPLPEEISTGAISQENVPLSRAAIARSLLWIA